MKSKVFAIIVTYKRQKLLQRLVNSIYESTTVPWKVIIIDNENSDETRNIVQTHSSCKDIIYVPQAENLGGAGGFREGIRIAYSMGADWLWVMDDDVEVEHNALSNLLNSAQNFDAIMGNREDIKGNIILSPYILSKQFGIANTFKRNPFKKGNLYKTCNIIAFEGFFFSSKIVDKIGLPDSRFFIYWDDITYGFLISKYFKIVRANYTVVKRTRDTQSQTLHNISIDKINNTKRYYMLRNRGILAQYMKKVGEYHKVKFEIGSIYTLFKEVVRTFVTKDFSESYSALFRGYRDMHKIISSSEWDLK